MLATLDASGLLGITVPRAHGGAQLGLTTLAEVTRILAAVDPAIAQVPQAHYLFVDVLAVWGSPEQRTRLFGDVLAGLLVVGFTKTDVKATLLLTNCYSSYHYIWDPRYGYGANLSRMYTEPNVTGKILANKNTVATAHPITHPTSTMVISSTQALISDSHT